MSDLVPGIDPPDAPPAAFWSHRWGRAGVYPPLVVCTSCMVRADKPAADQPCDHALDLAHATAAAKEGTQP